LQLEIHVETLTTERTRENLLYALIGCVKTVNSEIIIERDACIMICVRSFG
jgi:hypothetical protein